MNKQQKEQINSQENIENNKEFVFYNASVGRRILSYLADLFIAFIISIFLYEIVCFPITNAATGYTKKAADLEQTSHERIDLLYDSNILFYDEPLASDSEEAKKNKEFLKYDPETQIEYTGDMFLKFYVMKNNDDYQSMGLKEDPIFHYFHDIAPNKLEPSKINERYLSTDKDYQYFLDIKETKTKYLVMKPEYVKLFAPYFDKNDKVSDDTLLKIKEFKKVIYQLNYKDVIVNFSKTNEQYVAYTNLINDVQKGFAMDYQVTVLFVFMITFGLLFVLTPLVDKKGRTLGKMVCKIERVDVKTFEYLPIKRRFAVILLNLLEQILPIMFIPFISVGINEVFSLTILMILTIISAIYCIITLIVCFANSLGKSIKEILTNSVIVDQSLMDEYYREVVYEETRRVER